MESRGITIFSPVAEACADESVSLSALAPVISGGDVVGGIMVLDGDESTIDQKPLVLLQNFLAKYFE